MYVPEKYHDGASRMYFRKQPESMAAIFKYGVTRI